MTFRSRWREVGGQVGHVLTAPWALTGHNTNTVINRVQTNQCPAKVFFHRDIKCVLMFYYSDSGPSRK